MSLFVSPIEDKNLFLFCDASVAWFNRLLLKTFCITTDLCDFCYFSCFFMAFILRNKNLFFFFFFKKNIIQKFLPDFCRKFRGMVQVRSQREQRWRCLGLEWRNGRWKISEGVMGSAPDRNHFNAWQLLDESSALQWNRAKWKIVFEHVAELPFHEILASSLFGFCIIRGKINSIFSYCWLASAFCYYAMSHQLLLGALTGRALSLGGLDRDLSLGPSIIGGRGYKWLHIV